MTFLRFEDLPTRTTTRRVAVVSAHYGDTLATIAWYGRWRQYVVEPTEGTVWSEGCLEEVRAHLVTMNAEHRKRLVARRREHAEVQV